MDVIVTCRQARALRWARQFRDANPAGRALIEMNLRGSRTARRDAAVTVYEAAARQAGNRGSVIISVGHGGADATSAAAGMADLAPDGDFRIQHAEVFYPRRESDRTIIEAAAQYRPRQCRDAIRRGRSGGLPSEEEQLVMLLRCRGAADAGSRQEYRRQYEAIGAAFRTNRLREIIFLTCNIGSATVFVDQIATDWRVSVVAYQRRVLFNEYGEGSDSHIRVYLEGDSEGRGTNTDRARTELPTVSRYVAQPVAPSGP
jgi:hypothetical protein